MQSNPDGFLVIDLEGYMQEVNKSFAKISGYEQDELLLRRLGTLLNLKVAGKNNWLKQLPIHNVVRFESVLTTKDDKHVDVAVTAKCVEFEEHKFIYVFVRDISESKKARQALSEEKERAQVTLESIGDGVITTDIFGYVQYLNPVAEDLIGISEKEIVGKLLVNHLMLFDEHQPDEVINPISNCIENNKNYVLSEHKLFSANADNNYSVDVVVSPLHDDKGDVVGAVLVIHNTTELKSLAETLSYQATHDALTGLINRREFESRLEEALSSAKRYNHQHAMCYLDLDQFKLVNDTCGHIAGDELLRQLTQLLHNAIRETDTLARLGGDEFGVLLESCSMEQAKRAVDAIFHEINEYRFQWEGRVFDIGLSIGLVPITSCSGSLTDVLSSADSACYIAKDNGRNCMHMYVPNDAAIEQRRGQMEWVQRLQQALDNNYFELYCQSIKPVNGNKDAPHLEVLLRMQSDDGEIISPGEFLPAAERYHMMPSIDRWVLREVFECLKCHEGNRNKLVDIVAVNLSGQSMGDEEFLSYVRGLFDQYGVPGKQICFEVTETSVISNITYARNFISVMKNFGCRFALDDFGSGLSSFQYLKDLDVDFIKIDGSFIRSMPYNDNSYNMVTSINHIGHVMGLKTIAEFVENDEISTLLEDIGVDYIQGYYVDEPHPIDVAVRASAENAVV
ncbi:MAG: EAL domain-containing protein [Gammaproteobacteria bacterium]